MLIMDVVEPYVHRVTGISKIISILKLNSLSHVVQNLGKCQSQTRDIILSIFVRFYPKVKPSTSQLKTVCHISKP